MKNVLKLTLITGVILTGFNASAMESKGLFAKIAAASSYIWKPVVNAAAEYPKTSATLILANSFIWGIYGYVGFNKWAKIKRETALYNLHNRVISLGQVEYRSYIARQSKIESEIAKIKQDLFNYKVIDQDLESEFKGALRENKTEKLRNKYADKKEFIDGAEKIIKLNKEFNEIKQKSDTIYSQLDETKSRRDNIYYKITHQ